MPLPPKEFGARSPEALAKLKTAVATAPQVHSLSVSVPGAVGNKSGAFQRVTSTQSAPQEARDAVYGTTGKKALASGPKAFLGGNLRTGKGFKEQTGEVWVSHNGRGLYSGEGSTVRTVRTYEVAFDIPDGLGGVVSGTTTSATVTTYGRTLYLGAGPRYKSQRLAFHTIPITDSGHIAGIDLFASDNSNAAVTLPQVYGGPQHRRYASVGLLMTQVICFDAQKQAHVVILHAVEGARDAWGLPKASYQVTTLAPSRSALRGEDDPQHLKSEVHAFNPPKVPGAGASNVAVSQLTPLGEGRIGCVVGVHAYAHRDMPDYGAVELHIGIQRDRAPTWESRVVFKNSKPKLFFAVSSDYGASWDFRPLTVFDRPVPVWDGYGESGWGPADYVTQQPLIGWAMYRTEGIREFNEALGRYDTYALLFPGPDRTGSWDSRCVARVDSVVNMSHVVALTPSIWVLAMPMLDDRPYNNDASQYVRFRCVVLRTMDAGASWSEVSTPFSDLVSEHPTDPDRGYALKATVLREGCAVMKFYRASYRVGDPPAVANAPRAVRLAVTRDYGYTWQEVVPQGLPSLDPNMVGSLLVIKATATTSILAVTAWDAASGAYWVYTSKDDGLTWKRGAKVADGAHLSMDEVTTIDGTNGANFPKNFTYLTPLLDDQGRPAEINMGAPWSYDAARRTPRGPE